MMTTPHRFIVTSDQALSEKSIAHVRDALEGWWTGPVTMPAVLDGGLTIHVLDADGRVVSTIPAHRPYTPLDLGPQEIVGPPFPWLNVLSIALSVLALVLLAVRT